MRSVGLKILKNKLSEHVRLAAGGETVLVTDCDRVVAEIRPPGPGLAAGHTFSTVSTVSADSAKLRPGGRTVGFGGDRRQPE